MEKLLSIIIPTYNAAAYLEKGLSSFVLSDSDLMNQLEVIVVNDGTPDNSVEIAEKFVKKYPNTFRVLNKGNGGHGSAINAGVKAACGKFFKVIDADDWVDSQGFPQFIKSLLSVDAQVVVTPFERYDISTGKTEQLISKPVEYGKNYTMGEVMDQWATCHWDLHFWGVAYDTEFYRSLQYDLLEGVFYEDQEFATVPASYAERVCFLDTMVYVYRIGDVNQSVFGDTQVKRRSHLEAVIDALLNQYDNQSKMPHGADRYYRKKTAMVVTSYYQIMLLKNHDKKMGREAVSILNEKLQTRAPQIYDMTAKKCKGFVLFSYLHITNGMYEFWAPKLIGLIRKIKGQNV